ncbi:MAG: hypothetical protein HY360_25095 [Verrucomicrobia bacterium]|nr:hypothetical protein [Verrucomicrobiota bacterium]
MNNSLSIKQRLAQPHNVQLVVKLLKSDPTPTRAHLTREVCRHLDLRDPKGDWQIATTAKALRDLEEQNFWKLPETMIRGSGEWNPTRLNHPVQTPVRVPKQLQDIQGLRLIEVTDQEYLQL